MIIQQSFGFLLLSRRSKFLLYNLCKLIQKMKHQRIWELWTLDSYSWLLNYRISLRDLDLKIFRKFHILIKPSSPLVIKKVELIEISTPVPPMWIFYFRIGLVFKMFHTYIWPSKQLPTTIFLSFVIATPIM